mgnify:CR=1 FL=1
MIEIINMTFKEVIDKYLEDFILCEAFNVESDDSMALIYKELNNKYKDDLITYIFSSSIRANQLYDDKVTIYNFKKEKFICFEDFNFSNLTDSGIAYIANEVSNSVAWPGYFLVSSVELIKFSGIKSQ